MVMLIHIPSEGLGMRIRHYQNYSHKKITSYPMRLSLMLHSQSLAAPTVLKVEGARSLVAGPDQLVSEGQGLMLEDCHLPSDAGFAQPQDR